MVDFFDYIVNQWFKDVYYELECLNLIKGKFDIVKYLGIYNYVINSILKGQWNIIVDQLYCLFEIYGVDVNYLFGIVDDIFVDGVILLGEILVCFINEW